MWTERIRFGIVRVPQHIGGVMRLVLLKSATLLLFAAVLITQTARAATSTMLQCGDDVRLSYWSTANRGTAALGHRVTSGGTTIWASCFYNEGRRFPDDTVMPTRPNPNYVYFGFGDHCSEGQFLLFNRDTGLGIRGKEGTFEILERFTCVPARRRKI